MAVNLPSPAHTIALSPDGAIAKGCSQFVRPMSRVGIHADANQQRKGGRHMKLVAPIMGIIAGVVLLVPAERAGAQPVDCEAARCTIQSAIDA